MCVRVPTLGYSTHCKTSADSTGLLGSQIVHGCVRVSVILYRKYILGLADGRSMFFMHTDTKDIVGQPSPFDMVGL